MSRAEPNLTYNLRYLYALQIAHRLTGDWGAEAELAGRSGPRSAQTGAKALGKPPPASSPTPSWR